MVEITSSSSFKLENIRTEKTIIYFIIPAQHTEYYGFWTSIFFRSVFNACMREMPNKTTLPAYILYDEFGHSYAYSIQGGFNSYLTYSGSDPTTTQFFERISGRVIEKQKNKIDDFKEQRNEYNLMPADRVRTIEENEAVFVSSNKYPVIIKTVVYFKNWRFRSISKRFGQAVIHKAREYGQTKKVRLD